MMYYMVHNIYRDKIQHPTAQNERGENTVSPLRTNSFHSESEFLKSNMFPSPTKLA